MEAANADLASQCMMDKRALIDLREELVKEKVILLHFIDMNKTELMSTYAFKLAHENFLNLDLHRK